MAVPGSQSEYGDFNSELYKRIPELERENEHLRQVEDAAREFDEHVREHGTIKGFCFGCEKRLHTLSVLLTRKATSRPTEGK